MPTPTLPAASASTLLAAPNKFSDLKFDDAIAVSSFRRVRHSAGNWFQSIDRDSFTGSNVVTTVINGVGQVGGVLGGAAGAIAIGAGSVVVGAGFLAAVSGPQVAVTAAVLGIAMLVMATYSNREAAHNELAQYVYTMVDNMPPRKDPLSSKDELFKAAGAAATLMDDGKNQLKLMGGKLQSAQALFSRLNTDVINAMNIYRGAVVDLANVPVGVANKARRDALERTRDNAKKLAKDAWEKESRPGGAIHQYIRRCVHTSNYLQASYIISLAMREKLDPGSIVGKPYEDFFGDMSIAKDSRKSFQKLSDLYTELG